MQRGCYPGRDPHRRQGQKAKPLFPRHFSGSFGGHAGSGAASPGRCCERVRSARRRAHAVDGRWSCIAVLRSRMGCAAAQSGRTAKRGSRGFPCSRRYQIMGTYSRIVGPRKAPGTVSTEVGLDRRALLWADHQDRPRAKRAEKFLNKGINSVNIRCCSAEGPSHGRFLGPLVFSGTIAKSGRARLAGAPREEIQEIPEFREPFPGPSRNCRCDTMRHFCSTMRRV
jgi:hypothetical protein